MGGPAALLGVAGFVAFWHGPAVGPHIEGPPPAHTGGFGEPTCAECHVGASLNEPGSTLEVLGLGVSYRPGQAHRVTVRLVSFDMLAAGFQASFRIGEGTRRGRQAGNIRPLDGRVTVVSGPRGDTRFVQHTRLGSKTAGQVAEWTFEWRAPRGNDVVVLHVAANSGSGDNSPLDDLVYTHEVRLEPTGSR